MFKLETPAVFDVTDGPSGIKYVAFYEFLQNYYKTGRNADFAYMNFQKDNSTVQSITALIKQYCEEKQIKFFAFSRTVFGVSEDIFFNCGYGDEENTSVYQVEITGDKARFQEIFDFLKHKEWKFKKRESTIDWFFRDGSGGLSAKTIRFDKNPNRVKDIYYPFVNGGVTKYMKGFLKSDASILVMIGTPGTGKTSLVRDFAFRNKLKTFMTFDEAVIQLDDFFVKFMTDKSADLLVMEDADVLISSRSEDNNRQMAKFLNISDGLISHQGKKMIFTTNLSNVDRIDPALIRPGRCYGVLNFRQLTLPEVNIIRENIGKEPFHIDKKYTLTDAFNEIHSNIDQTKKIKIGLIP